jgi:hypothetical protein
MAIRPASGGAAPSPAISAGVARRVEGLVAAQVNHPADWSAPEPPRAGGGFAMYTRSADLAEAAVAIQVGRTLDVTG